MQTISGTANDQQRTESWHDDRLGKFSASQIYRLMTEPKLKADKDAGNLSEGAMTYIYECVAESLTGIRAKEEFTSKYTEWGIDNEPIAKRVYETVFEAIVTDTGHIAYGEHAGGSPDGLVGDDGIVEFKCPYTITSHLEHYLKDLSKKPEYYWQCLMYVLITGRKWIDFLSWHPAYKSNMQLIKKRLLRETVKEDLAKLESKLKKAIELKIEILNKLK